MEQSDPQTSIDTITEVLENVLEETDDEDIQFKLRTALQSLIALQQRHEYELEQLEEVVDAGTELAERLRKLGYLD